MLVWFQKPDDDSESPQVAHFFSHSGLWPTHIWRFLHLISLVISACEGFLQNKSSFQKQSSDYQGVSWDKQAKKWRAQRNLGGERYFKFVEVNFLFRGKWKMFDCEWNIVLCFQIKWALITHINKLYFLSSVRSGFRSTPEVNINQEIGEHIVTKHISYVGPNKSFHKSE